MNYDLGLSTGKRPNWWDGRVPPDRQLEFAVFALTPGIPAEFVRWWVRCDRRYVMKLFDLVDKLRDVAEPLAIENATSITEEDGRRMLVTDAGALPHWGSLALHRICREEGWDATARKLGVSKMWLVRHRKSIFHPLTLERLVKRRGQPGVTREYQVTR